MCPSDEGWTKIESKNDNEKEFTFNAKAGFVVSEVCIKGSNDIAHFTADGTKLCWIARGIGTNSATASEDVANWQEEGVCHDISHASFKEIIAPTSTPTPTPTIPATSTTPTVEPTHCPDPTATPTKTSSTNESFDNSSNDSSEDEKKEGEVLGASTTGMVLGATTYAKTGTALDSLLLLSAFSSLSISGYAWKKWLK